MSSPDKPTSLSELAGFREYCDNQGFDVEDVSPREAVLIDRKSGCVWSLFQIESWMQIKGLVLAKISPTQALHTTLMRLHLRLIGCRFGIDENDNLILLADVFPHDQSGMAIGATIVQMQWIVDLTKGLLNNVLETGIATDESAIDEAFELGNPPTLH